MQTLQQTNMNIPKLRKAIFEAVAAKKILKTGYVRQPGGLYPAECDTVAAHSHTISVLSVLLASEIAEDLKKACGVELNLQDVAVLAIFHDYGEAKSGDTGAQSIAMYNVCKLHNLERDGLKSTVIDWKMADAIMKLYDDYRKYSTPEALAVHIADNLEGFEKALENFHNKPWVLENALRIFQENIQIYRRRKMFGEQLGNVSDFLVEQVLIPGMQALADTFRIGVDMRELAEKAVMTSPQE